MIIVMRSEATPEDIDLIQNNLKELGFTPHVIKGEERTVIGAVGTGDKERVKAFVSFAGVHAVMPVAQPYKLASRTTKQEDTVLTIRGTKIGGGNFVLMAGPCSVETDEQTLSCGQAVKTNGGHFLRGGAYKPRTSPYSFQGHEEDGLKILSHAREVTGLGIVTELIAPHHTKLVAEYTDVIQIGARNMQNFELLKEVGRTQTPVLLKRGLSATLEELLMSAEYIMSEGNYNIMLCERGIRTYETAYRNTLDLNAVPALKKMTHLPIIVDPSHGTGRSDMIIPMSKAAIAAGADGLILEIHPNPAMAYSDGPQSLTFDVFAQLMTEIKPYVTLAGKTWS